MLIFRNNSGIIVDVEYPRILNLTELLKKKSFFLFGPRATGKTYLIKHQLAQTCVILDLLKSELFLQLSQNPSELEYFIQGDQKGREKIIVIDEIQKIPALLDEVHRLIESRHFRFLLTGSSARKLKRGQANLLVGRAWTAELFPLCWFEIPRFDLDRHLRYGGLPTVIASKYPEEELDAYLHTYLREEILAEGLIRKMAPFSRFLKQAALSNGGILNFANMGADAQVPPSTVREYYSILEDTLLGFMVEPWIFSKKRKAAQTAKFYFFDTGITHTIAGTKTIDRNSNLYGNSFEQFIAMELRAYLSYRRIKDSLTFWRSTHGDEVDFLVGDHTAIEVKSTKHVASHHFKGLAILGEEKVFKNFYMVSQDRIEKRQNGIMLLHWENFLEKLWSDKLF